MERIPFDKSERFVLTETGEELVKSIVPSVTKDLDFEDKCLDLIYKQDFFSAYELVRKRELTKLMPRGIGMDYTKPLSQESIQIYKNQMDRYSEHDQKAVAAVIFCNLIGSAEVHKLLRRLNLGDYINLVNPTKTNISFSLRLENLKNLGSEYYEIISGGTNSCKKCESMNGRVLRYLKPRKTSMFLHFVVPADVLSFLTLRTISNKKSPSCSNRKDLIYSGHTKYNTLHKEIIP